MQSLTKAEQVRLHRFNYCVIEELPFKASSFSLFKGKNHLFDSLYFPLAVYVVCPKAANIRSEVDKCETGKQGQIQICIKGRVALRCKSIVQEGGEEGAQCLSNVLK